MAWVKGALHARRGALWLLGVLAAASLVLVYAAVVPSGQVLPLGSKATPFSLTVFSSPGLPPEVRAQEAASAPLLFDRDTTTQHVVFAQSSVQASFEAPQEVGGIKVFGPAPYMLTVQAETTGGGFQTIAGLENLNLTLLPAAWTSFAASGPVTTGKLMFVLTPATGGSATGLGELEVWTTAAPVNTKSGTQLLEKMLGPTPPAQGRIYTALNSSATPTQAVVTPGDNNTTLTTNTFKFTLDREPAHLVRAYLTYELFGQENFVSVRRRINEANVAITSQAGGALVAPSPVWSTQVERINPASLLKGINTIKFTVLSTSNKDSGYTVRNVRVVGELDNGANAIEELSVNQPDALGSNPIEALYDGDLATGWQPYPADQPIDAMAPAVEMSLRRPTQLDAVSFYLSAPLAGQVQLSIKQAGQWLDYPPEAGALLDVGWNTVYVPASTPPEQRVIEGAKLTFQGGFTSSAEIREFVLVGSGAGGRTRPAKIFITYPNDGQFNGRAAHVQGFIEPFNNGSGNASIFIAGSQIASLGGTISTTKFKDDVPAAAAQADNDPWFFEIRATWPNGEVATTTVNLFNQKSQASAAEGTIPGQLSSAVGPKTKKTISHDESKLVVDIGTVSADTTITIQPLAETDVPALDAGMVNVTKGPRRGYRFLPHGARFLKNVNVTLPYDKALIPPGHSEDQVQTFFFDEQAGRWVPLDRVGVDTVGKLVNSTTNHFTDMINAVVTVPDHPQAVSFNPTSMKDIKAADPGAQVNLIEAPRANNQGDARLSYPIEVPPGRQGLQPQLAVQYSSSGSNGWMGMGWDIPVQAVSIDTRWGVPRYDGGLESETYTLSGEQLTPVAHRGELVARSADKVFHTRVEGQFRRIVRRGTHPNNYSWEVTDKTGVKYLYGATDPANETLADEFGNRFLWALCEIRDPNGNFVKYRYAKVSDPGVEGGSVAGSNLYLKSITYTGSGATEGLYAVTFTRDRELNETLRTDKQIDARGGFKRVTADLLRKIEVSFAGKPVRSYELGYNDNSYGDRRSGGTAFNKTLLTTISQFGADGALFNKHTLTYYDEIRDQQGVYKAFETLPTWRTGDDSVAAKADLARLMSLSSDLLGVDPVSAVSGQFGLSGHGSAYIGFSLIGDKSFSFGGKFGVATSVNEGLVTFVDINGDGLADKVIETSSGFCYRANTSGPKADLSNITFSGQCQPLQGLPGISIETSAVVSFGGQVYVGAQFLVDAALTFSLQPTYFSDVNGDGLIDVVHNGRVFFNRLVNGQPAFEQGSGGTPVPVGSGAANIANMLPDFSALRDQFEQQNPLMDTVRRWTAPFAGEVEITGAVQLVQDTSQARVDYGANADGVRVSVQHKAMEKWFVRIPGDDYAPKTPADLANSSLPLRFQVQRGDAVYFRVNSVDDAMFDQVSWNPRIAYTGTPADAVDVNGLNPFVYQGTADFTLAGRAMSFQVPLAGTLRLEGDVIKKGPTSDDVLIEVLRNGAPAVPARTLTWDSVQTLPILDQIPVFARDSLELRIRSDSPIDLSQIEWHPRAFYIEANRDPVEVRDGNGAVIGTQPGGPVAVTDDQGKFIFHFSPGYSADLYPVDDLMAPQESWPVPTSGTLTVIPDLALSPGAPATLMSELVLTVKKQKMLLAKKRIPITNGMLPPAADLRFTVNVSAGDRLFFDYSTRDPGLAAFIERANVQVQFTETDSPTMVPSAFHRAEKPDLFPSRYRGWSFVGYNANGSFASQPLAEGRLTFPVPTDTASFDPAPYQNNPEANTFRPWQQTAFVAYPRPGVTPDPRFAEDRDPHSASDAWRSQDPAWAIKAETMSSTRLGLKRITVPTPGSVHDGSSPGVPRFSLSTQASISTGFFASISGVAAPSSGLLDFMDMNGDRFPDIVGPKRVQYTRMTGGLESTSIPIGLGDLIPTPGVGGLPTLDGLRGSESLSATIGAGGTIPYSGKNAKGESNTKTTDGKDKGESPNWGLGFSGSLGVTNSKTNYDLVDVNGDGLPDRVRQDGGSLKVELNLGYRFAGEETWTGAVINRSRSLGISGGANLSYNDGVKGFAGGVNVSGSAGGLEGEQRQMADVNGDGLLDQIRMEDGKLFVGLNNGNGFAPMTEWGSGLKNVGASKSASLGGGVSFVITIGPLCLVGCYVLINPDINVQGTASRQEVLLADVDGDGYADHLHSTTNKELQVSHNRTGRTNLLKRVLRPLGATIDLEYARDGNTFDQPQSRWTMSKVTVFDGHVGEGADTQVTTYRYENGFYNRLERDFYGYRNVIEEHRDTQNFGALYRSVAREFRNDTYYTKGLLKLETLRDKDGRTFTETENSYLLRDVDTGTEPVDGTSTTATVFPQLIRTDKRFFEGQLAPGKTTFATQSYDPLGNISAFTDDGEPGVATDNVFATINYTNCGPSYISKPNRIEVRGGGTVMRLRDANIDCTTGNLTQVRQSVDLSAAVTDLSYFSNGNLQTVTGAANLNTQRYTLTYEYDPQVQTHVARITDSFGLSSRATYDLRFGKVETTVDANNNQSTNIYDAVGRVTQIFGPYEQGQATATLSFDYSAVETPRYGDSGEVIFASAMPNAITRHVDKDADGNTKSSGTIDTILFTDGLKRVIQTKKDATVLEGASAPQDRMIVSGQVTFDAFGRTVAQRYPMVEPKTPAEGPNRVFNGGFDTTVPPTTMTFDVLDRNTRTTIPDGTFTTTAYGFGSDRQGLTQFETVVTDANVNGGQRGAVKRTYRNVRELVTSVREFNNAGAQTIWTSYTYDALKQVIQVVDDKSNTTNVAYDNLGRRTVIDNPDTGRTETQYDLASNVTKKITANLRQQAKAIEYNYDFNRLTAISYPNFLGNNVSYTYGLAGAAFNSAGRITRITSQMGVEERQYGKLGETVYEKKTVTTSTGPTPREYETRFHFETFGRLLRITYPDGEIVTNVYDSGGNLQSASGVKRVDNQGQNHRYHYLQKLHYDKFEQRAFVEQGNGVKTAYTYDARTRRLSNLNAVRQGNNIFQDLAYSYDKVGNILGLQNQVEVPPANTFGGPTSQTFAYDDLYRLTHAEGTYRISPNKTHTYRLDLTYDTIHNILRKDQLHQVVQPSTTAITQKKTSYDFTYAYAPSGPSSVRPHAPIHIGERTFRYDANGNQTGWDHDQNGTRRNIVWDDENRIQSLFDNGHEKTYKYDDLGNRLIKRGPQGETVYVNQFYTDRPGSNATKHVYAGTSRIASKLMRQDGPGSNPAGKTPFEKDLYFYHPDHLGTSNFITDLNGKLYEHLEYFPFGEGWVEENSNQQRTPYHFTAKELDEETGLYYFGARYYDPRTSVWQSADPLLARYLPSGDRRRDQNLPGIGGVFNSFNLALYAYSHLNPLIKYDPDGMRVVSMDPKNNQRILEYLHKYTNATFKFNEQNELQLVGRKAGTGSSYYTNKVIQAINDKETPLFVDVRESMTQYPVGFDKKTDKFSWTSPERWFGPGEKGPIDVDDRHGGGFTAGAKGQAVLLVISGHDVPTMNADGTAATAKPEDVLMHEFLGHAAPKILGRDTGNAISNENKARQELKLNPRFVDPGHTE